MEPLRQEAPPQAASTTRRRTRNPATRRPRTNRTRKTAHVRDPQLPAGLPSSGLLRWPRVPVRPEPAPVRAHPAKGDLAMWRSRVLTELPLVMTLVVLYTLAVLF